MKAHIITIGDEILIGQIINTNAAYIGEKLTLNQIIVTKTSSIGDEEKAILDARLAEYEKNPKARRSWGEVKAQVKAQLRHS